MFSTAGSWAPSGLKGSETLNGPNKPEKVSGGGIVFTRSPLQAPVGLGFEVTEKVLPLLLPPSKGKRSDYGRFQSHRELPWISIYCANRFNEHLQLL